MAWARCEGRMRTTGKEIVHVAAVRAISTCNSLQSAGCMQCLQHARARWCIHRLRHCVPVHITSVDSRSLDSRLGVRLYHQRAFAARCITRRRHSAATVTHRHRGQMLHGQTSTDPSRFPTTDAV